MKSQMINKIGMLPTKLCCGAGLATALLLLATTWPARAEREDEKEKGKKEDPVHQARIFPPHSKPYGQSYSEWSGAWWRWAYSFPAGADTNPVQDPTGELAGLGQSGRVWFLAGSFGQTVTRTSTVPTGKALFFPIINSLWINIPELGDNPWSDEQRDFARSIIAPFIDNAFNLSCQIDGVEVKRLERYRTATPDGAEYMVTMPEGNLIGIPAGVYGPSVDDGIYLMLAPLPPGPHTIHFTAASEGSALGSFALDVTYHLNVVRPAHIIPPHVRYRGLSYGEWGAEWWKTVFSIPVVDDNHPVISGGAFGGDKGVVFLAAIGGGATIDVTIPAGTPLFFPVVNSECSVLEPDPFHGDNETELRACANGHIDNTSGLFAVIDGVPVKNLEAFRVESPLFEFGPLPEDNLFEFFGLDAPAGTTSPAVDSGVYLLLAPLKVGTHTIHVGGMFDLLGFSIDTTFNITVEPRGKHE
jgi:hypothetical protein